MEIKFNVTKEERKALVKAVGEIAGWAPVYKGAPSFAFAVDDYIIDRRGTLIYDERSEAEDVWHLLAGLSERGFTYEGATVSVTPGLPEHAGDSPEDTSSDKMSGTEAPDRLVIEVPIVSPIRRSITLNGLYRAKHP